MRLTKRKLVTGLSGLLGWLGIAPAIAALQPTASQTEGPFYPRDQDLFEDRDNDLVKITGKVIEAGGEILHLNGTLHDRAGAPLADARVEIWQCDVNGRYLHGGDTATGTERDTGFQGFGATTTDAQGRFSFRTIKPVIYPGRTPHIHAKLHDPSGNTVLTTQFYLAGDPRNERDFLYRRLTEAEQNGVSMVLSKTANGEWQTEIAAVI